MTSSDPSGVTLLIAAASTQLIGELPEIDILVLNAGTIERKPAADHGDEIWERVLEVNLTAPFVLARELGRRMVERGSGKIVFVASLLSFQGGVNVPGYSASKGGDRSGDEGARERVGGKGRERERDRARLHRDRQHRGAASRRDALPRDPRADPRWAMGVRRRISPERSSFSPRRRRTTCMAPSFPSTVDGLHDERPHRAGAHSRQRGRRRASVRGDSCRRPDVGRDHVPDCCGAGGDPPRGEAGRSRSRGGHSSHESAAGRRGRCGGDVRSGPVDKLNDGARCAERRHRVHSRRGDSRRRSITHRLSAAVWSSCFRRRSSAARHSSRQ